MSCFNAIFRCCIYMLSITLKHETSFTTFTLNKIIGCCDTCAMCIYTHTHIMFLLYAAHESYCVERGNVVLKIII